MNDRTLLFVDDEPNVLSSLKRVLRKEPYRTYFAQGAQEALDLLEKERVDVIISDLKMPGMDGFELLQKVEKQYPDIVRLVLSGEMDSESILKAIDNGKIYSFIVKPVNKIKLNLVIGQAIEYFNLLQEKRDLLKALEAHNQLLEKIIKELSEASAKIANGFYSDLLPVNNRGKFSQLFKSFNAMIQGLKERDFIRNTFGRYVDPEIAKELMKRPEAIKLGGDKRVVTILMSDLRGFTPFSQSFDADEIISILNCYYSFVIEVIQRHRGIIVDFYGDGLLAFFDPFNGSIVSSIRDAVSCAFQMQKKMDDFNKENLAKGFPNLYMGIGINSGEVVVGNIGSETRAKYGIVGAPVNITNRIQSVAKPGEVLIFESLYDYIKEEVSIKKSFQTQLKGVEGINTLYVLEK